MKIWQRRQWILIMYQLIHKNMNISTAFDNGATVYFMQSNLPRMATIQGIQVYSHDDVNEVNYRLNGFDGVFAEANLYGSLGDLMASLIPEDATPDAIASVQSAVTAQASAISAKSTVSKL